MGFVKGFVIGVIIYVAIFGIGLNIILQGNTQALDNYKILAYLMNPIGALGISGGEGIAGGYGMIIITAVIYGVVGGIFFGGKRWKWN